MALLPSFSTSQTEGAPSKVNFLDTSTGSDVNITQRRIYIVLSNGTYLVQQGTTTQYEPWNIAFASITLTLLTGEDKAAQIKVQWLDVSNTVLYESIINTGFTLYNETFDYQLTQRLTGNPSLIDDNNFFELKSELRTAIDSGNQCIARAADIFGAQQCYTIATKLRLQSQYYFNANA